MNPETHTNIHRHTPTHKYTKKQSKHTKKRKHTETHTTTFISIHSSERLTKKHTLTT